MEIFPALAFELYQPPLHPFQHTHSLSTTFFCFYVALVYQRKSRTRPHASNQTNPAACAPISPLVQHLALPELPSANIAVLNYPSISVPNNGPLLQETINYLTIIVRELSSS